MLSDDNFGLSYSNFCNLEPIVKILLSGPSATRNEKIQTYHFYQLNQTKLLQKCPQPLSDDDFLVSYQKISILGPIVKILLSGPSATKNEKIQTYYFYQLNQTKLLQKCPQPLSDDDFCVSYQNISILGPIVRIQ